MVINYRALVGLQVLNQRRPVSPPLPLPVRRNKKGEDYRWFSAGLLCGSSRAALACTHCLQGVKSCFAHIPSSMVTCLFFFLSLDLSSFLLSVRLPPVPFLTHLTHLCFCPNTQPSSPLSLPGCCPSTSFPTYSSSSSPSLRHLIHYPTISTIHRFHSISCSVFPAEFQWKHKYSYSILNASGLSKEKKKNLNYFLAL